jgi:hypothetical protein
MTLGELLAEEALVLAGVEARRSSDGEITWSRGGRPFAVLAADGSSAEFGLDAAVGAAAVRTPDVAVSGRGPGWVTFAPAVLDDHGADRAAAWFASAWRRLEPRN